jgi:predicted  nucleic acid-binding Zn-ribbon protein
MLGLKTLFGCGLLGFIFFGTAQQVTKPTTPMAAVSETATLQALLKEVQQIRASIPRANLNTFHADITLNRIRMQKETIDRLTTRLDETTVLIKKLQEESQENLLIRKTLEQRLQNTYDPVQRAGLEYAIEQLKLKVNAASLHIQELNNQIYKLTNQINLEQGRMTELNNRLDQVMRTIEAQLDKTEAK